MEPFPAELVIGDVIAFDLPNGEVLGLQVRAEPEDTWFRVLGILGDDVAEAVARPDVTSVRIISMRAARREANARVVGRWDVPDGSRGVPPHYYPGFGTTAEGVRGKGYYLEAPDKERVFVPMPTPAHVDGYVYPAFQVWENLPSLHANDWDNVRAYEARVAEHEAQAAHEAPPGPLLDLWELDEPYDRLHEVAESDDPVGTLRRVLDEACGDDTDRELFVAAALGSLVAARWAGVPCDEPTAQRFLDEQPFPVDADLRARARRALGHARLIAEEDDDETIALDHRQVILAAIDHAVALLEGQPAD